jgi:RNA polymerase-binding transcription factor DksA
MDDLDRAQQTEELHRAQALANVRRPAEEPETDGNGNRVCLDCGAIIPVLRISLINAVRCMDCQRAIESRNRNRGLGR